MASFDDIIDLVECNAGKDLSQDTYDKAFGLFAVLQKSIEADAIDAYKKRLVSSIIAAIERTY